MNIYRLGTWYMIVVCARTLEVHVHVTTVVHVHVHAHVHVRDFF